MEIQPQIIPFRSQTSACKSINLNILTNDDPKSTILSHFIANLTTVCSYNEIVQIQFDYYTPIRIKLQCCVASW